MPIAWKWSDTCHTLSARLKTLKKRVKPFMFHTITLFMLLLRAPFATDPFEPSRDRFSRLSAGETVTAPLPVERTCRKVGRNLVCTKSDPDNLPVDF